jgi:site-specific DNA-methyltransferase (adenine-specific)
MSKDLLGSLELNRIYQIDCLEGMKLLPEKSIDMILCDLPYGTTNRNKWDVVIPFDKMWEQYNRIIKDNGAILLFADEPFTSQLIMSNQKMFKQRITWDKDRGAGFLNAKKMLLKQTEDIVLFYKKLPTYNPQMIDAPPDRIRPISDKSTESLNYGKVNKVKAGEDYNPNLRYPTNLIKFSSVKGECNNLNRLHPTQKPVELCEWLMKTYSNENEIVLDNCMGSGTTAVTATLNNRRWIGFETDSEYIEKANKRLDKIEIHNDLNKF